MTTYPINLPSNHITSMVLTMDFANALTESPMSFASQVYDWGGVRWRLDFTLPPLHREDAEEWIAFLLALRGRKGTFLAGDPSGGTPRGVGGGMPLVKGANQTGQTLLIDGAPISTTGWLKKGDYFQLGTGLTSRLYKLIEDVNTNGSGEATLEFLPSLRSPSVDNATVTITNAKGLFRNSESSTAWTADAAGKVFYMSFAAMEAL